MRSPHDLIKPCDVRLNDDELVSSQPRNHVVRTRLRLQSPAYLAQQGVADSVPKPVVYKLEAVEIEIVDGKTSMPCGWSNVRERLEQRKSVQ